MNETVAGIRNAAITYLAAREHSRQELEQKLSRRFKQSETIQLVLDSLADENLQSDQRFSEIFVRQKIEAGKGPFAIRQLLLAKGISIVQIDAALYQPDFDWLASAQRVYDKKYREPVGDNLKERAKRRRFLLSRGFAPDIVTEIV